MFGMRKSKTKDSSWMEKADLINIKMNISDKRALQKLKMINLSDDDLQLILRIKPLLEDNIDQIVETFYSTILAIPSLEKIIDTYSEVNKLRKTLSIHLIELFSAKFDQAFLEKLHRIAKVHYHIGLEPAWYMGAFQNLQNSLLQVIFKEVIDRTELQELIIVINKLLSFEQQIVLELYEKENEVRMQEQFTAGKNDLKNKIIKISEGLLALAEETNASVETLVSDSQDVKNLTTNSNTQSQNIQQQAVEGNRIVQDLLNRVSHIGDDTKLMTQMVKKLVASSTQIKEVISIVQNIAEQTDILALNSAIEAARAGVHGRGFAVVSQEVKKLAEQTKQSISEIQSLISFSNQYTEKVIESLANVEKTVEKGINASNQTSNTFLTISDAIANSAIA